MSNAITRLQEIADDLEAREDTARSAAAEAGDEALAEKLSSLADGLEQDRERLATIAERLRRDAEGRAGKLTAGHDDQTDPSSDMGL